MTNPFMNQFTSDEYYWFGSPEHQKEIFNKLKDIKDPNSWCNILGMEIDKVKRVTRDFTKFEIAGEMLNETSRTLQGVLGITEQ